MINKKVLIAGISAIALIVIILLIRNSFMGNPISAAMADKAVNNYVQQNYAFLDLDIEKAKYNFKFSEYTVKVKSKTSIDTEFTISYSNGKVKYDDYESVVLGKFNTISRLSDEYSALAKSIVSKELGFRDIKTTVCYDKEKDIRESDKLKLDMPFDRKLELDTEVIISLELQDIKIDTISKFLTDVHKAFIKNDCIFVKYTLHINTNSNEKNDKAILVNGVTPADIEGGQLTTLLEHAKDNKGIGNISVYVKSADK